MLLCQVFAGPEEGARGADRQLDRHRADSHFHYDGRLLLCRLDNHQKGNIVISMDACSLLCLT